MRCQDERTETFTKVSDHSEVYTAYDEAYTELSHTAYKTGPHKSVITTSMYSCQSQLILKNSTGFS